jgi:hypothetical protein
MATSFAYVMKKLTTLAFAGNGVCNVLVAEDVPLSRDRPR